MRAGVTNMPGLMTAWIRSGLARGTPLEAIRALPMRQRLRAIRDLDVIAVNTDARLLVLVACLVLMARSRARLIGIDILLPRPMGLKGRIRSLLFRGLLRRVERFYLYQRDVAALDRFYGIGPRCEYIPFKCNVWDAVTTGTLVPRDQGYVLHAGRTHRDLACFLAASWRQPLPTILMLQSREVMREHGTERATFEVPPWVEVVEHDGDRESFERYLAGARLVVIAIRADTITSTGCSTMLDAMALGKCVVISEGPATRDILDDRCALIVPPGDPVALADAIDRGFHDDELRRRLSAHGRILAFQCAGADRLHAELAERMLAGDFHSSVASRDAWRRGTPSDSTGYRRSA
jgi:glycosyltransferase involved in cell wall biosynthesis